VNNPKSIDASEAAPRPSHGRPQRASLYEPEWNPDRILESAVVTSWADLTRGFPTGLIHIEYGFATDGTLDYLKVWSSLARGH